MPSTTPYELWLRGIDDHLDADALSECATDTSDDFPTAIAAPSEANGWLLLGFYAAHPDEVNEGERGTAPGGHRFDDPIVLGQWEINFAWMTFPDDEALRMSLLEHLRKRELFIAFETYEALAPQHTAGKVVAVNREYKTEHKDDRGRKQITLTLTKRSPYSA